MWATRLDKRERQVIELISDGLTNKEIGWKLHFSPFTIKSHVHNILEKLAIHVRIEIASTPTKIRVSSRYERPGSFNRRKL
ncbi:MAG: response regulator transcription factor [Ignavibacteria bacterium]|nr:response regulator transcription factor [Ignavibacteria bacterium]